LFVADEYKQERHVLSFCLTIRSTGQTIDLLCLGVCALLWINNS